MSEIFDLIIVGGGINGSALARLSAYNGLKVLLLDQDDFGSGSSSSSSIITGNSLRDPSFIRQKEFVEEKENLFNTAPHIVWFEKFILPNVPESFKPLWLSRLTLKLQSYFYKNRRIKSVQRISSSQLHTMEPHFKHTDNKGGLVFWDCMINDSRLVVENVIDAKYYGAEALNYHKVLDVKRKESVVEVTVLDILEKKEKVFYTDDLAFTTGPWMQDNSVLERFDVGKTSFVQGQHIFVEGLPLDHSFVLPVPGKKHYFVTVPWMGGHLVGSLEKEVDSAEKLELLVSKQNIEELLSVMKHYYPAVKPKIVCTFLGHRARNFKVGQGRSRMSSEHCFQEISENIYLGLGGKHLSHRGFAREYLEFIYGRTFATLENNRFPGGKKWVSAQEVWDTLYSYQSIDEFVLKHWMDMYGARALEIIDFIKEREGTLEGVDYVYYEALFCKEREFVRTPMDFMCRRSNRVYSKNAGLNVYESVLNAVCPECKERELDPERGDYYKYLREIQHCAVS